MRLVARYGDACNLPDQDPIGYVERLAEHVLPHLGAG